MSIGLARPFDNWILSKLGGGWDDCTMLAVMIVGVPSVSIVDRITMPSGIARDIWAVSVKDIQTVAKSSA